MNRVLIIEATVKTVFDAEATGLYEAWTPDEQAERLADLKRDVTKMLVREAETGSEVTVSVRIDEVSG